MRLNYLLCQRRDPPHVATASLAIYKAFHKMYNAFTYTLMLDNCLEIRMDSSVVWYYKAEYFSAVNSKALNAFTSK